MLSPILIGSYRAEFPIYFILILSLAFVISFATHLARLIHAAILYYTKI